MRHDLIGFVVGALDDTEHEAIRREVERDPELQRQLKRVEQTLHPLSQIRGGDSPPTDLAGRTCERLDQLIVSGATAPEQVIPSLSPAVESAQRSPWGTNRLDSATSARSWTVADFVVAAGVCLAASCLFFPAIVNSRYHAQMAGCQNKLRQLGVALNEFSGNHGGYFPVVTGKGPTAVAGSYLPMLAEKGLVTDGRLVLCPAKGSTVLLKIPRLNDLANAEGPQLVRLHRTMGGDYAYPLGFIERGQLQGIRNQGQSYLTVMADAPIENLRNVAIGTHGRGQNLLFQDGHVAFSTQRTRPGSEDDLFVNDQQFVRAGLHATDLVLAPSYASPFGDQGDFGDRESVTAENQD